jgi:hypothetical protein
MYLCFGLILLTDGPVQLSMRIFVESLYAIVSMRISRFCFAVSV